MRENDLFLQYILDTLDFEEAKSRILEKYNQALQADLVDSDMIPINATINSLSEYVTTSSCTGRLIIISKDRLRAKYETKFHLKTHNPSEISDISLEGIEFLGELWVLCEAPNIHVRCSSLKHARILHQLALESKLSKSKYQSIEPSIIVEVLGTGSLQIPIGTDGTIMIDDRYWNLIKARSREILQEEQQRLNTFNDNLQILK